MAIEDIRRESYQIALAFGVNRIRRGNTFSNIFELRAQLENDYISWYFFKQTHELVLIRLGDKAGRCVVHRFANARPMDHWEAIPHPTYNEQMVRGLCRLGFEEDVLNRFNHPLSAHEKLELRLCALDLFARRIPPTSTVSN